MHKHQELWNSLQSSLSVEEFARRYHRLHPIVAIIISKILGPYRDFDHIPLSPSVLLRIAHFRKDVHLTPEILEEIKRGNDGFATEYIRKLPVHKQEKVKSFVVPFSYESFMKSLMITYIIITKYHCLPSGRISGEKVAIGGKKLRMITTTPCFMFLNLQIWGRGILNYPGYHCGNTFDLSTIEGFSLYLHELYHIFQFLRKPIGMIWGYIKAIHDSLIKDRVFFSHRVIPFELEAIAFQYWLEYEISSKKLDAFLSVFKKFQS